MLAMTTRTIRESIANFICPEQKVERRSLERLANYDDLTGLANRRAFDLAAPAAELDPDVRFVMFDANNFGRLNKVAGHAFGDQVLKEIGAAIIMAAATFGISERAFRLGGDEFVVLADASIAIQFRDLVENLFGVRFPAVSVSVSGTIGSTLAEADGILQLRKAERKGNL